MADFRVIEGGGPDKEERERQQARERAEHEFSWAIREVAANTLRIIRGAGKPEGLLLQMKRAIEAAVKFRESHGIWPDHMIANELQIQSGVEIFYAGLQEGRHSQASIDRWTEDGTFEELHAEHAIQCGALQMIASELIGQRTQKSAGEREFNQGIRDWIKNREMQARRQKEELRASRSAQSGKKKK